MDRQLQKLNVLYDSLMFAGSPAQAKKAALELIQLVLGHKADGRPFDENLRAVCRRIRPADDAREQVRFEAEFIELVTAPTSASHGIAA